MSFITRINMSILAAVISATLLGTMIDSVRAADKISVAVIPIADCAPIYLGKAKSFFLNHGLDVDLSTAGGGAMIIPGVLSGQVQMGFSNVTSLLIAQDKGLRFIGLAPGAASSGVRGQDFSAIIAPDDSPISSAKDFENKTIAVNTLNNIGDISIRAGVRAAGGDPAKVKFIEVPFPDVPPAISDHRLEAAWVVEPFLTIALSRGAKVVNWNLIEVAPKMMIAVYFTSEKYAKENPDIVKRFKAALIESLVYADAHPDEIRAIIPTFTRISPEIAAKITLPKWPAELNRQSTQVIADLALKDGMINKKANISALLP